MEKKKVRQMQKWSFLKYSLIKLDSIEMRPKSV